MYSEEVLNRVLLLLRCILDLTKDSRLLPMDSHRLEGDESEMWIWLGEVWSGLDGVLSSPLPHPHAPSSRPRLDPLSSAHSPVLLPIPDSFPSSPTTDISDPAGKRGLSETTLTTLTYLGVACLGKTGFHVSASRGRGRKRGAREGVIQVLTRIMLSCPDHREWILTEVVSLIRQHLSLDPSLGDEGGEGMEGQGGGEEEGEEEEGGDEGNAPDPKSSREERYSMGQLTARVILRLLQACGDGMMIWSGWFFNWLSRRSAESRSSKLSGEDWEVLGSLVAQEACHLVGDIAWPIAFSIQEILLLLAPSLPGKAQVDWSGPILLSLLRARTQPIASQEVDLPHSSHQDWSGWLKAVRDQYGLTLALSWIAHQVSKDRQAHLEAHARQKSHNEGLEQKEEEEDGMKDPVETDDSWDEVPRWKNYLQEMEEMEDLEEQKELTSPITLPHSSYFLSQVREKDLLQVIHHLCSSLLSNTFPGGITDRARAVRLLGRLGPNLLVWLASYGSEDTEDRSKGKAEPSLASILIIEIRGMVDTLMHRYSDTAASIREAAVHALGKMCLVARAKSRDMDRGIWKLLRTGMYPLLTQRSHDPSVSVRRRLVEFLRHFYLLEEDRMWGQDQTSGAKDSSACALLAHVSGTILRVIAKDEDTAIKVGFLKESRKGKGERGKRSQDSIKIITYSSFPYRSLW